MNLPNIPGFIGGPTRVSLSDIWAKPDGLPDALWPEDTLGEITNTPTEWVTLTEHDTSGDRWHAVDCALVPAAQTEAALGSWDWFDSHHGSVTVWADGTVEDGLAGMHGEVTVEFFAQAREVSGASNFVVDISHPFLWYWEAYPVPGGWRYTDRRGREHELRHQGREYDVVLAWHPLAGRRDATEFHLESGRLCVMISRHRHACVVVGRAGTAELLDAHPLAAPVYLDLPAKSPDGWEANQTVLAHLLRHRAA